MAIPEPELELLREVLTDDPGNDAFLLVARELVGRMDYAEAISVIDRAQGVRADLPDEAWSLLGEAALRDGRIGRALGALQRRSTDPVTDEHESRLLVLVLEQSGKRDLALECAEAFLDVHPQDVVVQSVVERLTAPPPDRARRLADAFVSVARAEAYAEMGRPDRAVRTLRRLYFHYPAEVGFGSRIAELRGTDRSSLDDLSEEIENPGIGAPPGLTMPQPGIALDTIPSFADLPTNDGDDDPDSELTDPAIDVDIEAIRQEIAARRAGEPAGSEREDEPFVYGAPFDDVSDEDPTAQIGEAETEQTAPTARSGRRSLFRS